MVGGAQMKFGMRKPSIKNQLVQELQAEQKEQLKRLLFQGMGRKAWDG